MQTLHYSERDHPGKMSEELTKDQLKAIADSFAIFDKNGDGKISSQDLFRVMLSIENGPSKEQVERMIRCMDLDGDGKVSFPEYLNKLKR